MWVARTVVVLVLLLAGGALVPYFESMDTVVADNVKLGDGTWIARGDLATFPTKAQRAIREKGLGAVEDADKLEPEPRFRRMKELGFVPSDAEFAGTNKQGVVLYTTPTAFSHLEGAELERVFKKLKPEFFVDGRNILLDVMKRHKGGGPEPTQDEFDLAMRRGSRTDAYTHSGGEGNTDANGHTCSNASSCSYTNSNRPTAYYAFAYPHSDADAAYSHADAGAYSSAFAADRGWQCIS